jgi:hypothetical protein
MMRFWVQYPGADDAEVDFVSVVVSGHGVLAGQVAAMDVEEVSRVVVGGPD